MPTKLSTKKCASDIEYLRAFSSSAMGSIADRYEAALEIVRISLELDKIGTDETKYKEYNDLASKLNEQRNRWEKE